MGFFISLIDGGNVGNDAQTRYLDHLTVVEERPDGKAAIKRYRPLHQQYPEREFYFIYSRFIQVVVYLNIQVQQRQEL